MLQDYITFRKMLYNDQDRMMFLKATDVELKKGEQL